MPRAAALRTKLVVFTGGEPLVREDVFESGGSLPRARRGPAPADERPRPREARRARGRTVRRGHRLARRPHASALRRGPRRARPRGARARRAAAEEASPGLPIRAPIRSTKRSFRALPDLIEKAESMGLDQISFLAADVDSDAFGRAPSQRLPLAGEVHGLLLDRAETDEFERVIEKALVSHRASFRRGRVAERGERLRRLAGYYRAHQGRRPSPRWSATPRGRARWSSPTGPCDPASSSPPWAICAKRVCGRCWQARWCASAVGSTSPATRRASGASARSGCACERASGSGDAGRRRPVDAVPRGTFQRLYGPAPGPWLLLVRRRARAARDEAVPYARPSLHLVVPQGAGPLGRRVRRDVPLLARLRRGAARPAPGGGRHLREPDDEVQRHQDDRRVPRRRREGHPRRPRARDVRRGVPRARRGRGRRRRG